MSRLTGPLKIESLAYGGKGVARVDGKVLFVTGAAPGDLAICRLTREKKRYAEAELAELVEASELRRKPPCPVADQCGGCQWQYLEYADQCRWKEDIFRGLLQRQAGVEDAQILPIVPAPDEWHYRSRVQFKCFQHQGKFLTGFYRPGSHVVVDVDSCPVVAEKLNAVLAQIKPQLAESPFAPSISQIDMGLGDDGQIRVVIHTQNDLQPLADYCRPLAEETGISLFLQSERKKKPQHVCGPVDLQITIDQPPLQLAYGPGGFAQINLQQNRNLVEAVLQAAQLSGTETVLDLYCGMGNFSLPLARQAGRVVAVEDFAPSIAKGRENAAANGIENVSFECRPAEGYLNKSGQDVYFDLVLLDPPRSGAYPVMAELLEHRPRKIIYVSCDPATLARDLKSLLHGGYRLDSSQPFDLFPQTYHMESLSVLVLDV